MGVVQETREPHNRTSIYEFAADSNARRITDFRKSAPIQGISTFREVADSPRIFDESTADSLKSIQPEWCPSTANIRRILSSTIRHRCAILPEANPLHIAKVKSDNTAPAWCI